MPAKLERCVRKVRMRSRGKVNPYAVCKASFKKRAKWLKEQIKDERMSAKMYRKKGFPQIARDERRHVVILTKELKGLM
jgi:hypothetical protein